MVATTPNFGLRYNQQADPSSRLWVGSQELAEDVDARMSGTGTMPPHDTMTLEPGFSPGTNVGAPNTRSLFGIMFLRGGVDIDTPAQLNDTLISGDFAPVIFAQLYVPCCWYDGTTWHPDGIVHIAGVELSASTPGVASRLDFSGVSSPYP